jgi:integrase
MRKKNPGKFPDHINPQKLPSHVGLDPRGNGFWYYRKRRGCDRGKQYRLGNLKLTLPQIYAAVERIEKLDQNSFRFVSLEYQKSQNWNGLAESTRTDYEKCHKSICARETRNGNKLGDLPLESWTPVAVRRLRDARAAESPSRAKKEIAYLKVVFQWAIGYGHMQTNPAKEVQTKNLVKPRTHYIHDSDYLAAINIAPLNIAIMMHLGYLTGRRRTDIVSLHKELNSWPEGLFFEESKTDKCALVLWSDELRATFELAKELSGNSDWLFPAKGSNHHYSLVALDTAWQKLSNQLTKDGFERFQFRDIRAKHATDLEDKGGDATANLLHSDRSVTQRHYLRKPQKVESLR